MHRIRITVAVNIKSSDRDPPYYDFMQRNHRPECEHTFSSVRSPLSRILLEDHRPMCESVRKNIFREQRPPSSGYITISNGTGATQGLPYTGGFFYMGVCAFCAFSM